MNTKNLKTMMTILETGSFQKAADQLNYTQSTITFQIKQLEEELSFKLFERIGRKMELTQAGKEVLPYIETILQAEEQIRNHGRELSEIVGELHIAVPDSILIYNLQPFIQEFTRRAPHVQLVINSISSDDIDQAIITGSADIGINCDKGNYAASIISKQLSPFKAVLVASAYADTSLLDFITPHQRKPLSMVCNEPNSNYQRGIADYFASKDIVLNPDMRMQSIEAVKRSVMNNLGIAYIPIFAIREELRSGALIAVDTEIKDRMYTSVCVYHKNKWMSPQMKLALKLLDERPEKEYV
ncbi:MAG: LysR family transcriptional regulator [Erysipelotrichaceae bacterium]|nr:LysR family transcriptional regulator [Erysipelotrichaceae bacterium]